MGSFGCPVYTINPLTAPNPALLKPIPYARQEVTQDDLAAVEAALRHDYLTGGPGVGQFEEKFATYIGAPYAVAVSSGTAALHLCALALEVTQGDRWLTTPLTFVASANCILYAGGQIDLVDIDPETYLMDLDVLEQQLQSVPTGTYKGVVGVDFAGYPLDWNRLRQLADTYDLKLIEDSCHAPGARVHDGTGIEYGCGDGSLADLAIFSFHPTKHLTTAEGGIVTTGSKELYQKLIQLRNHGITRDRELLNEDHGGWYYEMQMLGFNYRLSDLHCALGISQLSRTSANLKRRREIAHRYDEAFASTPDIRPAPFHPGHAYHLYVIQSPDRKALYNHLREHGIFTQVHYIPVHFQPYYQELGFQKGQFPQVEAYYEHCLSLPMFATLTDKEQDFVIEKIRQFRG